MRIPSFGDSVAVQSSAQIAYSTGTFVLAPTYDGNLAIYRPGGQLKPVGQAGRDAGQFRGSFASFFAAQPGVVHAVFHNQVSVLSADGAMIVRQFDIPWRPTSIARAGEQIVAISAITGRGKPPDWTVLDGKDGSVQSRVPLGRQGGDVIAMIRTLSTASQGGVWSAHINEYVIDLVDINGVTKRSITRKPSWWRTTSNSERQPFYETPNSRLVGARQYEDSVLVVISLRNDKNWKPYPANKRIQFDEINLNGLFDSVIDMVDLRTGSLIQSATFDDVVQFVSGSDYLWSLHEGGEAPVFVVFKPELIRR